MQQRLTCQSPLHLAAPSRLADGGCRPTVWRDYAAFVNSSGFFSPRTTCSMSDSV